MRSLVVGLYSRIVLAVFLSSCVCASLLQPAVDDLAAARQLFRQGDFHKAAAAFEKIIAHEPSPQAYFGLVESLLKLDDVKSADEGSQRALTAYPKVAYVHAARGDVLFRRGMFPEAGDEYKAALALDPDCARALLGQGKIEEARSRRRAARQHVESAHNLDPEDGDALYEWSIRQQYPDNVAGLEHHLAEFRSDPDFERHEHEYLDLLKALAGRKVWILDPEVKQAELKMEPVVSMGIAVERRGFGLRVGFNDRASTTLLLDTGASGVTITRRFAEKIGARKLSDQVLQGIGKGGTAGYQAWVDKITVGDLTFHNCFVHVVPQTVAEVDGLIGTDVFVQFLVAIDFPTHKLRLAALPEPRPDSQAAPDDPSPAYGFGHILLLPTSAGEKASGLFVLDTGSNINSISNERSSLLSQMRRLDVRSYGVGGGTNSAFTADGVALQFANVRRRDQSLHSMDMHSLSKNLGTEVSGLIGFAALEDVKVLINYRDGWVKIEEKGK